MRILVDMDGILADILGTWLPIYNAENDDNLTIDGLKTWDFHKYTKNGHKIYDVLERPGFFSSLLPLPGAVEGFKALQALGHEVCVATAGAGPVSAGEKVSWCEKWLGLDRKHIFIGHKKFWIDANILIDDKPEAIKRWVGKGDYAHGLTLAWPYNLDLSSICFRAKDWSELVTAVKVIGFAI